MSLKIIIIKFGTISAILSPPPPMWKKHGLSHSIRPHKIKILSVGKWAQNAGMSLFFKVFSSYAWCIDNKKDLIEIAFYKVFNSIIIDLFVNNVSYLLQDNWHYHGTLIFIYYLLFNAAWASASLAIGTRKGEHET